MRRDAVRCYPPRSDAIWTDTMRYDVMRRLRRSTCAATATSRHHSPASFLPASPTGAPQRRKDLLRIYRGSIEACAWPARMLLLPCAIRSPRSPIAGAGIERPCFPGAALCASHAQGLDRPSRQILSKGLDKSCRRDVAGDGGRRQAVHRERRHRCAAGARVPADAAAAPVRSRLDPLLFLNPLFSMFTPSFG